MTLVDDERLDLLSGLRRKGIRNEAVLTAIGRVDRRRFVLRPFMTRAYEDTALPIGDGQTISQPYTVAFMTEALAPRDGSKILEIGTGSGYQAAILAELGCRVFTIERHMELHLQSRKLLQELGYRIASRCGDGTVGWNEFAPYDGVIVTAAAPSVPQPLLLQLADGGRMVVPVGGSEGQSLRIVVRSGSEFTTTEADGFKFVPLIGKMGWEK